jgi:hypothetical protein|tara:strand:+ start:976 stop:1890 length:915 start_codon:yes stop_codon:yes gene_type:complete
LLWLRLPGIVAPMSKAIYIHAGAHRTGSSSFQSCLHHNRDTLAARGFDVAYPGRDGVPRGRLRLRLPASRHGENRLAGFAEDLRGHLQGLSPDPGRALILSEENIVGRMLHFSHGQFYPVAEKRIATLARAQEAPPRAVLLVVRPYAGLYVSAWRKRAEDTAAAPFSETVQHLMAMDRGWPDIITALRDGLRPERLIVVDYAQRGESRGLLHRLVPEVPRDDLAEPDRQINISATDAALQALQARLHAGEKLARPDWQAVIADHAQDTRDLGLTALTSDQQQVLNDRYASDLDRIRALPGVLFA